MPTSHEGRSVGEPPAGDDWVAKLLDEEEATVRQLVAKGLTEERARDLFYEVIEACVSRKTPLRRPLHYFRAALDKRLKRYLRDETPPHPSSESILENTPTPSPTPLEELWATELRALAEGVLQRVAERPAEVARLHLDGWSLADIARELGLSPSTVRTHWATARQALEELDDRLGG